MKLQELFPNPKSRRPRKRVGRGRGSGLGKSAGRGQDGQLSRSGHTRRYGFEGGQMPLIRRVPKRGFHNKFRTEYAVLNVAQLAGMDEVSPESLRERGWLGKDELIKILGNGELDQAVRVKAHAFSESARAKIEKAGGSCEVVERKNQA